VRINVVSPVLATDAGIMGIDIPQGMPAAKFAPTYRERVEEAYGGEVLDVRKFA
jgi:hypothetical protein